MKRLAGLVPHPVLSVSLLAVWLALQASLAPGQVLLGACLGLGLPLISRSYWPERPPFHRLPLLWRLFLQVNWDIAVACVTVARLTLTRPADTLQPRFATIRTTCRNPYARVMLISIVTITPGTVVADFDEEHGLLLVHWLHEPDLEQAIRLIETRYDRPLKEIIG